MAPIPRSMKGTQHVLNHLHIHLGIQLDRSAVT